MNPETRFLIGVYCSKQGFIVETGFIFRLNSYNPPLTPPRRGIIGVEARIENPGDTVN